MLRELAERTGLVTGLSEPLLDSYKGLPFHAPGRVLTDLAVAVADGATNISGIQTLTDRQDVFGPVASMPTTWRVLDRVTEDRLPAIRKARAEARSAAWDLTRATFREFGFSRAWIGLFPGFGVSADRTNRMLERCGSGG